MTSTDPSSRAGHHYSDAEMHNDDVAHEHSDVSIQSVLAFGAGMVVIVIVAAVLMYIMYRVLEGQAERRDPQMSPVALPADQEPPAPRLLKDEPGNLRKFRAEEMKKLESYGWVDERGGVVRLPIEEAKKLIFQRGLPVRASGPINDPLMGTHAPAYGEASGGRAIAVHKAAPAAAGEIKK